MFFYFSFKVTMVFAVILIFPVEYGCLSIGPSIFGIAGFGVVMLAGISASLTAIIAALAAPVSACVS